MEGDRFNLDLTKFTIKQKNLCEFMQLSSNPLITDDGIGGEFLKMH